MTTYYYADDSTYVSIKPVEVERETESCVWIGGRKRNKMATTEGYFLSFEDAKAWLMNNRLIDVEACRRRLEYANGRLGNVKGLKP